MIKPGYKVIYNQDATEVFTRKKHIKPKDLEEMIDEVADGGADVMLLNPNCQRVNYPSKVWQTFWEVLCQTDSRRKFFGSWPDTEIAKRRPGLIQMKRLAEQGCNYLTHTLQYCRVRGITPGVSVRMNDMHDAPLAKSPMFSRFYVEHPEMHISNPKKCLDWGMKGLNYEHKAVRLHYLSLIRELVTDYDFDVMELDFLRFQHYFPRGNFSEHCDIMTDFIGEVRKILISTGRHITLIPRVAATPAAAQELGFDVVAWTRKGIVDAITIGSFLNTGWNMQVAAFRSLVGNNVGIYASTDYYADMRKWLSSRALPLNAELIRGFASGYLATGADGICFFNFFCAREEENGSKKPLFSLLGEAGSLDDLRCKSRTHLVMGATDFSSLGVDGALQLPVCIGRRQSRRYRNMAPTREFQILLATPIGKAKTEVAVVLKGKTSAKHLWMHFNDVSLGHAFKVQADFGRTSRVRTAIFPVPNNSIIRDGLNRIVLRNEGEPLDALGLEVRIRC